MFTVTRTVRASQPVARVAEYLSDFTTTEQWDPHMVSCHRIDGGQDQLGARYHVEQKVAGRTSGLDYQVTAFEPGRTITLEGENGSLKTIDTMSFEADPDGGTSVTYRVEVEPKGAARYATPLLRMLFEKLANDGADGMKSRLAML